MSQAAENVKTRILYRNESCLVINKLPGESSEFPELSEAAGKLPVHRLDVPVSGCLLFADDAGAATFLSSAFAPDGGKIRAEKTYWAIVEKPVNLDAFPREAEIVHWLCEDKKANKSYAAAAEKELYLKGKESRSLSKGRRFYGRPKKAVLRYRILGEGDNYLFLEIDLVTGRHHQIRAQLAALGLFIKGDLKYGARRSEKAGGIRLHARSLCFPNPINHGEMVRVEAPLPFTDPLWTAFIEAEHIKHGGN